jgi:hypothetical protein
MLFHHASKPLYQWENIFSKKAFTHYQEAPITSLFLEQGKQLLPPPRKLEKLVIKRKI